MITAEEAERIAARWVAVRSEPASGAIGTVRSEPASGAISAAPREPASGAADPGLTVHEFELGYVVSAGQTLGAPPFPFGAGYGIIDKETAELSVWPDLPVEVVMDQYRERQARRPAREWAWDRAEQARWYIEHLTYPATVSNLSITSPLTHEPMSARSVQGDTPPYHHRLVVDFLHNELAPEHRVRGYERCSEAAVISDALYAEDARRRVRGEPPIILTEARTTLFAGAGIVTYRARELSDPLAGEDAPHCLSCILLARHFGFPLEDPRPADPPAAKWRATKNERFPAKVAEVLRAGGWEPGRRTDAAAVVDSVREQADPDAEPIEPFDAATAVITEFGGLSVDQDAPGVALRRRPFTIDPTQVYATGDTLADLGKRLNTRLFPIGTDGNQDSILAVEETGRVYALDHAGVWYLGDTIDAALVTLVTGAQPFRLDSRGEWCPPPPNAPQ